MITLPSDTEILITRAFDAPAALVLKAWTTPELVKRWWGFGTEVYEGFPEPDAAALNTITFDEVDGVTTLTTLVSTRGPSTAMRTSRRAWRAACRSPTTVSRTWSGRRREPRPPTAPRPLTRPSRTRARSCLV